MSSRRDLVLVCSGSAVSEAGSMVSAIALILAMRPHGTLAVAGVLLAEALAVTLCAPLAGMLTDRLPNRRLMMAAQVLQGLASIGIAAALPQVPAVLGLLFLLGCGSALANPAASALIPVITGEDGATRGYSWLSAGDSLGTLLGSTGGAIMVSTVGSRGALLVDAASYLAQAALLLLVRAERRGGGTSAAKAKGRISAGVRHLLADRVLAVALGTAMVAVLAAVFINVVEVFLVTGPLHGGAPTIGLLNSCWMIGAIGGARLAGRGKGQRGLVLGMGGAGVLMGVAFLVTTTWPVTAVVAVAFLAGGVANAVQNVCNQALVRERTPEEMRGRAFAARGAVLKAAFVLGIGSAGLVLGGVGVRPTLVIAGLGSLVAGLAGVPFALGIRETAKGGTDQESVPPEAAGGISLG